MVRRAAPEPKAAISAFVAQRRDDAVDFLAELVDIREPFGPGPVIACNAHGGVVPPGQGWTAEPSGADVVLALRTAAAEVVALSLYDLLTAQP